MCSPNWLEVSLCRGREKLGYLDEKVRGLESPVSGKTGKPGVFSLQQDKKVFGLQQDFLTGDRGR